MPQPDTDRLKAIKSLPQLVAYLRDELDWPIESAEPEEILFDYAPGELGLDAKAAVNIKEIRQLRPLAGNQPWGIFFVNFEKKQLPVSVMRLILRALVFKKRASANKADRQAWQPHDLLFVSSCGTDNNRSISFAHFVENKETELSELRVLGWDDDDTPLHMDYVSRMLHEKLGWDAKLASNPDEWRSRWSEAFLLKHRHTITKADELAEALAELATKLRNRLRTLLKYEDGHGEIRKLQRAFEVGLIHDLNDESFSDMFAQTVTYGLFSVAVRRTFPGEGTAVTKDDPANLIFTSPFLKEMLGVFLGLKSRKGKIDFDQLGISDVTDLLNSPDTHMEVVLADFNNKTRGEDPVIHFYEHFLSSYNKKLKVERGVFYTPQPVVSYIVRSVHELLKTEFGLEDGLADITTWGEMLKKHPGLKLPPLTDEPGEKRTISPDEPFVQILDPATGTATFLVEIIHVIHKTLSEKWGKEGLSKNKLDEAWNDYVPKHLLPRLHAFELMMAPYAIAHMKIGLKLAETGYRFGTEERARIYLTNALEPWVKQLPLIGFDALAHEAAAVNEIKRHKRFTVVIGNPPYSIQSQNLSVTARAWVDAYRKVNGILITERNALQFERNLQDDYVKFLSMAQSAIAASATGVISFITNNGYIDSPTFRGMRWSLLHSFPLIQILDLHGASIKQERCPDASKDENVFDIQQGVAIGTFLAQPANNDSARDCGHADLWGRRSGSVAANELPVVESKYDWLADHGQREVAWTRFAPQQPYFLFIPQDQTLLEEYNRGWQISEAMPQRGAGIITARDNVVVSTSPSELIANAETFQDRSLSDESVCRKLNMSPKKGWNIRKARSDIAGDHKLESFVRPVFYRPFDTRIIFYHRSLVWGMSFPTMRHMIAGPNIGFCISRSVRGAPWRDALVSNGLIEFGLMATRPGNSAPLFPLYLYGEPSRDGLFDKLQLGARHQKEVNFASRFKKDVGDALRLKFVESGTGDLTLSVGPEDIFRYIYAILFAPSYRNRYAEFLKIDFPRLPLTGNLELFRALAKLGGELTALHLLESPKLAQPITEFIGGRAHEVEKVSWSNNMVWIDKAQTIGFKGVREDVWNFHIGGYQVCEKWLKDRKNRKLSKEDITHYQKVVVALSETIRLMKEVDTVIDKHGGWPGAFSASKETAPEVQQRAEANKEDKPPPIQQSFL
jgi:hypothetical protein